MLFSVLSALSGCLQGRPDEAAVAHRRLERGEKFVEFGERLVHARDIVPARPLRHPADPSRAMHFCGSAPDLPCMERIADMSGRVLLTKRSKIIFRLSLVIALPNPPPSVPAYGDTGPNRILLPRLGPPADGESSSLVHLPHFRFGLLPGHSGSIPCGWSLFLCRGSAHARMAAFPTSRLCGLGSRLDSRLTRLRPPLLPRPPSPGPPLRR